MAPPLLCALVALAGCGGGGGPATSQTVAGVGFSFQAPLGWRVARRGNAQLASSGAIDRVEVLTFTLEHPYRPTLFDAAARELDGVVERLAARGAARVIARSTLRIAGGEARSYRLAYTRGRTQELAFVLSGEREFELLCQRRVSGPAGLCSQLFRSFALAAPG